MRSLFDVVVVAVAKVHAVDAAPTNIARDSNDFIVCCCYVVLLCCVGDVV